MKPVGKLDAGNRHVQFDEKGWKTEPRQAGLRRWTERSGIKPPATYRHRVQPLLYNDEVHRRPKSAKVMLPQTLSGSDWEHRCRQTVGLISSNLKPLRGAG